MGGWVGGCGWTETDGKLNTFFGGTPVKCFPAGLWSGLVPSSLSGPKRAQRPVCSV